MMCKDKEKMHFKTAKRRAIQARRKTKEKIVEYHCPYCGYWHIGHKADM